MYGDKKDVEYEMCVYTGNNNWGHRSSGKGFEENLEAVPGKHTVGSLQQTAVLGTSHTMRKVLQSET